MASGIWSCSFAGAIAMLLIAAGIVEAVTHIVRFLSSPRVIGPEPREVWPEFSRWLVAALTFQLAGDIVDTCSRAAGDERSSVRNRRRNRPFLSCFLDREVETTRGLQQTGRQRASWEGSRSHTRSHDG